MHSSLSLSLVELRWLGKCQFRVLSTHSLSLAGWFCSEFPTNDCEHENLFHSSTTISLAMQSASWCNIMAKWSWRWVEKNFILIGFQTNNDPQLKDIICRRGSSSQLSSSPASSHHHHYYVSATATLVANPRKKWEKAFSPFWYASWSTEWVCSVGFLWRLEFFLLYFITCVLHAPRERLSPSRFSRQARARRDRVKTRNESFWHDKTNIYNFVVFVKGKFHSNSPLFFRLSPPKLVYEQRFFSKMWMKFRTHPRSASRGNEKSIIALILNLCAEFFEVYFRLFKSFETIWSLNRDIYRRTKMYVNPPSFSRIDPATHDHHHRLLDSGRPQRARLLKIEKSTESSHRKKKDEELSRQSLQKKFSPQTFHSQCVFSIFLRLLSSVILLFGDSIKKSVALWQCSFSVDENGNSAKKTGGSRLKRISIDRYIYWRLAPNDTNSYTYNL